MNTYQCRSRKRNEKQAMRNYGERDEALIPKGNSSGGAFVTVFLVLQDLIKLALRTTLKSTASVFPSSSPVLNSKCQSVWQQRVTLPLITSRLAQKVLLNFFVWNPKMKRVKKEPHWNQWLCKKKLIRSDFFEQNWIFVPKCFLQF